MSLNKILLTMWILSAILHDRKASLRRSIFSTTKVKIEGFHLNLLISKANSGRAKWMDSKLVKDRAPLLRQSRNKGDAMDAARRFYMAYHHPDATSCETERWMGRAFGCERLAALCEHDHQEMEQHTSLDCTTRALQENKILLSLPISL